MLRACARAALVLSLFALTQCTTAAEPQECRAAARRGAKVHVRPQQDLPGHGPRLLGLCAEAVRPGQAGLRLRQPGRHPVQRAGRLRRADRTRRRCRSTIGVFVMHGRVKAPSDAGARPLQPQLRVRRPGRRLRPVPARRTAARRREEDHGRRPADPALARRQRPLHRRRQQRRDLRVHGRLGTARRLPPRVQRDRHLRRPARRQRLSDADPQVRAEADPRLPPGRQQRPEHLRRRLVDGQPGDGARADASPATRSTTSGATAATTASTPPRSSPTPCAGSGKTGPAPVKAGAGSPQLQEILHPRRGLAARRRGLQVHRRPGRQRQGRGLLQRHPQQQDLQDRPRRQGRASSSPTRKQGQRPGVRARRPALRRRRRRPSRSSPTTPTGKPRTSIADGFRGNDLVVRHDGGIYVTNPSCDGRRAEQGLVHQPQGREEGRRHRA